MSTMFRVADCLLPFAPVLQVEYCLLLFAVLVLVLLTLAHSNFVGENGTRRTPSAADAWRGSVTLLASPLRCSDQHLHACSRSWKDCSS